MKGTLLRFAIAGYGMIAHIHARSIGEMANARLVAVYGNRLDRAQAFAAEYGVQAYDNYAAMLADPHIDAVCVLTPSGTHARLGTAAAAAGKHVVVEKPIDVTLDAADRLIEACRRAGVKLCVISQHRYDQAFMELKRAVDTGLLGQLNFGASHTKWYRDQAYYDDTPWRGTWAMDGGGALINQSIHYVDLLRHVMGPVEEVFAYSATRAHARLEAEDIAAAAIRFASGAIGLIEANTASYPGFAARLEIYGSDGGVVIENDEVKEWKLRSGAGCEQLSATDTIVGASNAAISHHAHRRQLEDFAAAIREDREPQVNGEEGRSTLQVVLAVYESARSGKPVRIR